MVTKAPAIPYAGPLRLQLERLLRWRSCWLRVGDFELDVEYARGAERPLARSTCFSLSTPLRIRAASRRDLQAGYNYMLPNRIVIGAEADVTFPGFPNNAGVSIGGAQI